MQEGIAQVVVVTCCLWNVGVELVPVDQTQEMRSTHQEAGKEKKRSSVHKGPDCALTSDVRTALPQLSPGLPCELLEATNEGLPPPVTRVKSPLSQHESVPMHFHSGSTNPTCGPRVSPCMRTFLPIPPASAARHHDQSRLLAT